MIKIKCLIIDDDVESVKRLEEILQKLEDVEIKSHSTNASLNIDENILKETDIVFLAIEMSGKDGFEIIEALRSRNYFPVFVFISPHKQYAIKAIKYAIFDYLLKPIDFNELKACLKRYISLNPDTKTISIRNCKICDVLSNREKEVLSYIIQGYTSREISKKLFISLSTINFHRHNILEKTNSKNFSELSFKISEGENIPIQYRLN